MTESERLRMEKLRQGRSWTAKAYQMRLVLQDIYAQANEGRAREAFVNWCHWVRDRRSSRPK